MPDSPIKERLVDTIRLLIGSREASFPFEREISLYQVQTWAYFPDKAKMPVVAGRLAAAKFLERIEEEHAKSLPGEPGTTRRLAALFKIAEYRALFDAMIAPNGGWLSFLRQMTPHDFDYFVASRHDVAATVVDLLDYRYRYLDHGGTDLKFANISHAYVFRFNDKEKGRAISGSTIRDRWTLQKQSAVFVYVSERTNFEFFPHKVGVKKFPDRLTQEVSNRFALMEYFGKCAYVAETFGPDERDILTECFPPSSELTRIRLETDPLPLVDGQIDKLANYKDDYQVFKDH